MYLDEGAKSLSVQVLESVFDVHHVNLTPGHNHTHQCLIVSSSTLCKEKQNDIFWRTIQ